MQMDDFEPLMDVRQVAKVAGNVSVATVWRHTSSGKLPKPIKIGGSTRWLTSEIKEFLSQRVAARNGEIA